MYDKPRQEKVGSLDDYLRAMSHGIFVAGMNWSVIDAKWDGIIKAFDRFDVKKVAAYNPNDIERLMSDPSVIRNRKKIEAIIANAGEIIVTDREFGGFDKYLASFSDNDELVKDLHRRFEFLGESVAHFFLFAISYNLPAQEKWAHSHLPPGVHHGPPAHAERHVHATAH